MDSLEAFLALLYHWLPSVISTWRYDYRIIFYKWLWNIVYTALAHELDYCAYYGNNFLQILLSVICKIYISMITVIEMLHTSTEYTGYKCILPLLWNMVSLSHSLFLPTTWRIPSVSIDFQILESRSRGGGYTSTPEICW